MNIDNAIIELKSLLDAGISGHDLEMFGLVSEDSIRTAIKCMERQVAERKCLPRSKALKGNQAEKPFPKGVLGDCE